MPIDEQQLTPKARREAIADRVASLREKHYDTPPQQEQPVTAEQLAALAPFLARRPALARWVRKAAVIIGIYEGELTPGDHDVRYGDSGGLVIGGVALAHAEAVLFASRMAHLLEEAAEYHHQHRAFRLVPEPMHLEKEDGFQR